MFGARLFISAAVPATIGEASEVPHSQSHFARGRPLNEHPGAPMVTQLPRLDQLYRRSDWLVAATLMTPEYAAGYERWLLPSLPAAATTTTPFLRAYATSSRSSAVELNPAMLMLITSAP